MQPQVAKHNTTKLNNSKKQTPLIAAKATYIRLLHGKIGFLGVFSALAP